jgi:hypothetical protein
MTETQGDYEITGLEEVFDQPPVSLNDAICQLAQLRLSQNLAKEHLAEMRKALEESPEYLLWYEALRIAETDASLLEAAMKKAALDAYAASQEKHAHPALSIRANVRLVYAEQDALDWSGLYLPKALKLDNRLFEKHARAVLDTAPLPFVEIVTEPAATIASDLSHYLIDGAK